MDKSLSNYGQYFPHHHNKKNTSKKFFSFHIVLLPICTELTSSVVKTESDSSEEKSDHLYEMVEGDSEGSSNGSIKLDDEFDNNLPETVSVLKHPNGAKVYLVGTAHFSKESQEDVSFVMN